MLANITKILPFALLIAIIGASSCNDASDLGTSLSGDDQWPALTDTVTVKLEVMPSDAINANVAGQCLLGQFNDPVFGQISSGLFMNFVLNRVNPNFTDDAIADSLVLQLAYDTIGAIGDTISPQSFEVYRLTEDINKDTSYLSTKTFAYSATTINHLASPYNFLPKPRTNITVLRDTSMLVPYTTSSYEKLTPHLRIRLDQSLADALLVAGRTQPVGTTGAYNSNVDFKSFFKGIYIKPVSNGSGILSFSPLDVNSVTKLKLYYRDYTGTGSARRMTRQSFTYTFNTLQGARAVCKPSHDYTGTSVLDNSGTSAHLHGLAGTMLKVTLPYVDNDSFRNVSINKAVLELTIPPTLRDRRKFPLNAQVTALFRNSSNKFVKIYDYIGTNDRSSVGGFPYYSTVNGQIAAKIELNISDQLQGMIRGTRQGVRIPKEIYLLITFPMGEATGTIFANHNHLTLKPKVKLYGTKY